MTALDGMFDGLQDIEGGFAAEWGQSYDVRRLDDATNGSITNNAPVVSGFRIHPERTTKKSEIENVTFDILVYEATCDNRQLQIGDVLTQMGSRNDGSIFTLAQMRDLHPTLMIRTAFAASLSRPMPTGGAASQQPSSGVIAADDGTYAGIDWESEQWLRLQSGSYSFSGDNTKPKATVQVEIQPLNRVRDGAGPLPTMLPREHYVAYIPILEGTMLNEKDRIRLPNMDAYEIALIASSDLVGLAGYICICERVNV